MNRGESGDRERNILAMRRYLAAVEAEVEARTTDLQSGDTWAGAIQSAIDSVRAQFVSLDDQAGVSAALAAAAVAGPDPDVDLVEWVRAIFQGVVARGGPVLLFEVVMIVWFLAAQVSTDARQQVSELAGLIALALALAPGFKAAAERLDRKKDDGQ